MITWVIIIDDTGWNAFEDVKILTQFIRVEYLEKRQNRDTFF